MISPTQRGVLLMAAGAPLALLVAVAIPAWWFVGLLWIPVVATLIGADWIAATRSPQVTVRCAGAVEVGLPLIVHFVIAPRGGFPRDLELAIATGPRLRPVTSARIAVNPGETDPMLALTPVRRGTEVIDRLWTRWGGPLGLIREQREHALEIEVMITPDVRPVRESAQLLLRDAQAGELARRDRGEGSEFESLSEWQSGMDRRSIDWSHSARHRKLLAREVRIEKNNQIVFAIDAGRAMCEPVDGLPRVDRAVSAALLAAFTALKLGDRVALFGFDSRPRISSGMVSGARAFPLMQRLAAELEYSTAETNYTHALATLAGGLTRRSLVVIFAEFADQTGAEMMIRAVGSLLARHLVLFVILEDDELEGLAAAEPQAIDDVSLAVTAAAMLRERRIVVSRLRHLGIHVLEAPHRKVGRALVRQYLEFKRMNLL